MGRTDEVEIVTKRSYAGVRWTTTGKNVGKKKERLTRKCKTA